MYCKENLNKKTTTDELLALTNFLANCIVFRWLDLINYDFYWNTLSKLVLLGRKMCQEKELVIFCILSGKLCIVSCTLTCNCIKED